jgi:uncharacterized membrane protein YdjX (TVP38/TMEM64 family)
VDPRPRRRFGAGRRFQAIDAAVERRSAVVVALLRLSSVVRFAVLNYVLAISKVKPALGMLPGTALFVYLGSVAGGRGCPRRVRLAVMAVGLVATVRRDHRARLARRALARTGRVQFATARAS